MDPSAAGPRATTSTELSARRRWIFRAIKLAVVLLVFAATAGYFRNALAQLNEVEFTLRPGWLVLSGGLYLVGLLPCAWFWGRLLTLLGQPVAPLTLLRAYYIGHLGKYVPGKAMVVVLRCALVHRPGVSPVVAAATTLYETLAMMTVGAATAGVLVAIGYREHAWIAALSLAAAVCAGIPILPPVFRMLLLRTGAGKRDPQLAGRLSALHYRALLAGAVAIASGWWLIGLSLWATLRGMGLEDTAGLELWPLCTATVCVAVVIGFLSLVPGGAGIREAVLLALLTPVTGGALAFGAAVVLRLTWLVSELTISVILYAIGRRRVENLPAADPALEPPLP